MYYIHTLKSTIVHFGIYRFTKKQHHCWVVNTPVNRMTADQIDENLIDYEDNGTRKVWSHIYSPYYNYLPGICVYMCRQSWDTHGLVLNLENLHLLHILFSSTSTLFAEERLKSLKIYKGKRKSGGFRRWIGEQAHCFTLPWIMAAWTW